MITWQKWMPRTLFPSRSKGGDQHITPMTLGTTSRTAPETPDLAGKPTWTRGTNKKSRLQCTATRELDSTSHEEWPLRETQAAMFLNRSLNYRWLTWKANCPEKSYMPQECMRLKVLRTASALSTRSPVIGQIPPLASVAAMTLPDSQVTSMEHN